jgi:hypothetical protein
VPYHFTTFTLPSGVKAVRVNGSGVVDKGDADLLMREISPGGPYYLLPRLFTTEGMERMTPEARTIFSGPSDPEVAAVWCAAVVTNLLIRVSTNFLLRVSRMNQSTLKMFSTEKEALAWLDERVRESAAKKKT